ncbi:MAG: methyltransferase domain-containing protein, partial [Euryarchaeota archaeon]|nr:methyltransferase domain-containing protein [Euryarchaeota archaeon]
MKLLDLGCGVRKRKKAIGVDINKNCDADIIHDLNIFPYPFKDNEFDDILCDNVIEHLENITRVLEELWRISKNGTMITIYGPYFRSKWAFTDSTHKHFFAVESFSFFDPNHIHNKLYKRSEVTFSIDKIIFDERINTGLIQRFIKKFA